MVAEHLLVEPPPCELVRVLVDEGIFRLRSARLQELHRNAETPSDVFGCAGRVAAYDRCVMNVLITGSSGQVGTNLALALLEKGHVVRGVDKRVNAWTQAVETELVDLVAVGRGAELDVRGFEPDCIVHLAAWAKVFDLVTKPGLALENVEMTFAALELARTTGGTPVLLASSREVYGDIELTFTREHAADHVVAESPYSASKLASEALVHSYSRCYGVPCLVARLSNVYGRFDNDVERLERVVPLFVRSIYEGRPIEVYGREKVLDFTHVDDCVEALVSGVVSLVDGKILRDTVNISFGQGHSLFDLVTLIELVLGKSATASYLPPRVGEIMRYVGDTSKAQELLGFTPRVPLPLGIRMYVDWCREIGWIG